MKMHQLRKLSLVISELGGVKNVTFISKDVSKSVGSAMRSLFGGDVHFTISVFQIFTR